MEKELHWKPKTWIAVLLAAFLQPLSMLYVGRPVFALVFLGIDIALAVFSFVGIVDRWIIDLAALACAASAMVLAYRACRASEEGVRPWYSAWYNLLGMGAGFSLLIFAFRVFCYEPFLMPSTSMVPTLELRSRMLVQKFGYGNFSTFGLKLGHGERTAALHRGDLIVFDYPRDPRQTFVKRLVGLPGDRIQYLGKTLLVNGQSSRVRQLDDYVDPDGSRRFPRYLNRLDAISFETIEDPNAPPFHEEAWDFPMNESCARIEGGVECLVPEGRYFFMGDNRDNSLDSRYWGYVRADQIIGRVVATFH